MFCEKCGTKLPVEADFCPQCGTGTTNGKEVIGKIDDTQIQLRVKPTYKFLYMVLPSLLLNLGFIIFLLFLYGFNSIGIGFSLFLTFIFVIRVFMNKKQYDGFCYDFYKTKVIYKDQFLNRNEKEVKYKYIREVTMRQTFIQRFFNVGDVILFTNAETGYGNGINIMNVENVQDVYRNIKSIID